MFRNLKKQLLPQLNLNNGVLILAFLITMSWAWGTVEAIQRNFALQQEVDTLKQQNALAELQNQTLEFQRSYYNTNEFLELSAREHLGKALPGEKVLILPPNTAQPVAAAANDVPLKAIKDRSNVEQWMYFLFAKKSQPLTDR